ncbi:MAG: diguanylate cyclase [Rhodanobacter sp.]|nr:MAG: diguanylate cyclase [Rhodanobacter sp.]TAM13349.1 MAG: diguanylate cyclase [Rhodanobacter sp.]TAM35092.1 MAG: diguanylate cyclase [Rhodanobacter sp.]
MRKRAGCGGRWWQLGLILVLAGGVLPAQGATSTDNAAAFDQLAGRLDRGEIAFTSQGDLMHLLERLQRDVPPGDARRELRYQYLYCVIGPTETPQAGIAYANRGLAAARRIGYVDAEINFLFCRGSNQEGVPDTKAAMADYDAAIALARRTENNQLLADGLTWRGRLQSVDGEYAKATVDLLEAQRYYASIGASKQEQDNLLNIATAYRQMGEYAKARGYFTQALTTGTADGDVGRQMTAHMELGFIDLGAEPPRTDAARAHFDIVVPLARKAQAALTLASAQLGLAQVDNQAGQWNDALKMLDASSAGMAALHNQWSNDMIALQRGVALAGLGQLPQALAAFDQAEQLLHQSGNLRYYGMLLQQRSRAYEAQGNTKLALADLQRAIKVQAALDQRARSDTATLMRYQFDTAQREAENQRLKNEQRLQEQQLASLQRARRWQQLALLLGAVLIALLTWLAIRQIRMTRRLREIADTDPLTGIANRRNIEWRGQRALDRAMSAGKSLAVVLLDIDHFKQVNDTHGHQTGDAVLVRLAQACRDALREGDAIGRIGGEEFVVLLPGAEIASARDIAERLRLTVSDLAFHDLAPALVVTVSLGVTVSHVGDSQFGALVERADRALYRAKSSGRNQVAVAGG